MSARKRILLAHVTPSAAGTRVYATWNPADKQADIALSGADLVAEKSTTDAAAWACVRATVPMVAGQWYWETKHEHTGSADVVVGIAIDGASLSVQIGSLPLNLGSAGGPNKSGQCYVAGAVSATTAAVSSGTVVRHWLDCDAWVYRVAVGAGAWVEVGADTGLVQYIAGNGGAYAIAGILRPSGSTVTVTANFGASPFLYTPPSQANAGVWSQGSPTPQTMYLSSDSFDDGSRQYDARIAGDAAGDVEIERAGSCYVWGAQSMSRRGKLVVLNGDGGVDGWKDYEWRDALVELYAGYEGDAFGAFTLWSVNRVDSLAFTDALRVELTLADPLSQLDRALQSQLFPADLPNAQAAGKPVPIVYGAPLYCTAVRLDTSPAVRNYQLADTASGVATIADIYDNGDRFGGPDDAFTPHHAVTSVNGGDFGGWSGGGGSVPQNPAYWGHVAFGGVNDKFSNGGAGDMRCQSVHAPAVVLAHTAATLAAYTRYKIQFTLTLVTHSGILTFRVGSVDVPFTIVPGMTGVKSTTIDTRDAGPLRLVMSGDQIDVKIRELRVDSQQTIDWTYYDLAGAHVGFTLVNAPCGKVVANPVGSSGDLYAIADDVCNARLAIPNVGLLPGIDLDTALRVGGATVGAWPTYTLYDLAAYIDKPVTALSVLREAADAFCGWITSNRIGQLVFGKVAQPDTLGEITLDDTVIIGEIVVSDDLAKGLTLRLSGRRNNSPHAATDIASSVTDQMRAELQTEMTATVTAAPELGGGAVSAAYVQAINAPARATMLQAIDQLQAEANRVATLWRVPRRFYTVTALLDDAIADGMEPGKTVTLRWPRYGLDAGRQLLVVAVRSRFFSRRVDFTLWG